MPLEGLKIQKFVIQYWYQLNIGKQLVIVVFFIEILTYWIIPAGTLIEGVPFLLLEMNVEIKKIKKINRDSAWEKSIRARWGESLAESKLGYTPVPNIFLYAFKELNINPTEALFILQVMSYKWTVRKPFPSFKSISRDTGLSENTIRSCARSLENKNLIKREFRRGHSSEINFQPLIFKLEVLNSVYMKNLHSIRKTKKPYQNSETKEDELRRLNKGTFNKVGELIQTRKLPSYE